MLGEETVASKSRTGFAAKVSGDGDWVDGTLVAYEN